MSWIANKLFQMKKKNENITRVQNMLLQPAKMTEKFVSPTLFQLQQNGKNVKKMSSIYEESIAQNENKALESRLEGKTPLTSRKMERPSMKIVEPKNKILELFENLLERDTQYISSMKKMMDSYIYELFFEARFMEEAERDKLIISVFGYIKLIHEMHKEKFHPFLKSIVEDMQSSKTPLCSHVCDFARKLNVLLRNNEFQPYLLHAMVENEAIIKRENFYTHLMVYAAQKYQFNYTFDPMSQIMHYCLITEEILREVVNQSEGSSKTCINHLRSALKEFNNFIIKIRSANNLSS